MQDSKNLKTPVFIGVIVAALLIVGYFLWKGTSVPEPVPGPGQTIQNPLGTASPGGGGGGPAGMPAPGTATTGRGMGPSRNAPVPK
jgi:hypothetical protein